MERFRKRFILIASALIVTQLGGTLGFIFIEHYPPFDAFYMTLITISTVGYGEVHTLSHAGRIFNSFLIFFGVTIMLLAVGGTAFLIRERATAAVVYQLGLWLDAFGLYFIFRYLLRDTSDLYRLIKMFVFVVAVLGVCMSYEYLTGVNVFSHLVGYQIVPWVRDGRIRAQGSFGVSITAGIFGATLIPLFFLLWKQGKSRLWASIGLASGTVVAITSMASTPITGYLAGILALCLWPIRKRMRWVRWGVLFGVLGLALAMKAPVWFVLARINIANGNAYDRAILVDATVRHFFDWWLVGTNDNAIWMH